MTDHEVEAMYAVIKGQLASAGMEPHPSLSPAEVVAKMYNHNGPGQGLPFPIKMTGTHAADVEELKDALQWDTSAMDLLHQI
ncbi:hypothetical protein C8A03DRAFT_36217 [Achaetomium macrosporum]|uniref:Uncharacterized protein n=1 Tax=Achaetomium macrosporum TaxID=79813 RepID=A0AAN7HCF9_9PEZI|nr:hypothetical protein C8A03DRAFT_36217 [Achaetomium macrosporum]